VTPLCGASQFSANVNSGTPTTSYDMAAGFGGRASRARRLREVFDRYNLAMQRTTRCDTSATSAYNGGV
ncbi:MAG TPA: hypothetical protein VIV60_14090, partial [Polyangiaceae bacterium]